MKIAQEYLKSTIEPKSLEYKEGTLSYRVTEADDYFLIAKRSLQNFLEEKGIPTVVYAYSDKNENFEPGIHCRMDPKAAEEECFKLRYRNFIVGANKDPTFFVEATTDASKGLLERYYYFLKSL